MSRRQLVPSNVFYRKADPNPPLFPEPWEGDIYFNTTTKKLRLFHDEKWRDASFVIGEGAGDKDEVWVGPLPPEDPDVELWVQQRWWYNDVYTDSYDLAATFEPSILAKDSDSGWWVYTSKQPELHPVGSIISYAPATAPPGWVLCDGAALLRTQYPKLWAAIGTTYGIGNGSTTFNVPDLRGRTVVARDPGQTEFSALNQKAGAKTHTLTIAEMPSHSHSWNASGVVNATLRPANWDDMVGGDTNNLGVGPAGVPEVAGNAIKTRGDGGAHNNLQPYIVLNCIIKAT